MSMLMAALFSAEGKQHACQADDSNPENGLIFNRHDAPDAEEPRVLNSLRPARTTRRS
jgi:hypothetical protein